MNHWIYALSSFFFCGVIGPTAPVHYHDALLFGPIVQLHDYMMMMSFPLAQLQHKLKRNVSNAVHRLLYTNYRRFYHFQLVCCTIRLADRSK
jgi:hypothetical protein